MSASLLASTEARQAPPQGVLMWLDTVPAWRGPAIYEVTGGGESKRIRIDVQPLRQGDDDYRFLLKEVAACTTLPAREISSAMLARMAIRQVADVPAEREAAE